MKRVQFIGMARLGRVRAFALAAVAVSSFIACSDSKTDRAEGVATVQSALSGGADPVVRYFFNEASGTQASDSSGNGHSASLQSGATFVAGARGNAVRINGGTQRVALPQGVVGACEDLTIAARVNLAANSANWTRIFDFGSGTTSYMFLTPRAGASNVLRFGITTGGGAAEQQISHTFAFPTNAWKHVAVVLSGNTGTMYLDGVQVAQNPNVTLNPSALGQTANNWLGDSQFAADPTLNGTVDDVVVSCRAYSAPEVAWLATGTDPVASYSFNETSGTTAADSSGNARHATLANGASFVTGLRANAVQIAGGSQRVNLPTSIVQSCTDLTIAAHIRLATNATNWARIFDFGANATSYMFLTPRAGASNVLRFAITTGGGAAEQRLSYTYSFPTNTWKHVAVVLSGNTGTMYLDGVQVAQNTAMTLNPSALGATANNWLGDSQFTADPTLNGTIDNLLVSCRPYSPSEIGSLAGACATSANCNDGNACTTDTCNSGFCSHSTLADGTSCADATLCNGSESCQNGFCSAGTPLVVDDGNACTTDACNPVSGVTHTPITGGSCSDAGTSGGAGGLGGTGGTGGAGAGGSSGSGGGATCPTGTTSVEMFIELPPTASRATIALGSYGFTPLEIHDRVRILAPGGTSFASVSSLSGNPDLPTRLGVESHVHHLFGEPNVELRDRSHVHGNAISPGSVTPFPDSIVDGQIIVDTLTPRRRDSWLVCHPNSHQGNIDVQPGQVFPTNGTRLATGAWGTLAVKTGARIRLRGAATYFFESIAIEPGGIVDLDTAAGGIQLYFRNGGFFRGVQERTNQTPPNVLFGAENGNFSINGSFRGTVVAPRGIVDLPTAAGGHRGSFFGALVVAHQSTDITHEPVDTTGMCPPNTPCNGLCPCGGGGGGRGTCHSDGDCQPGLVCTQYNGACFGGARSERFCWPEQCLDGIDPGECGTADSPCGQVCGCGNPCNTEQTTPACPPGEECIRDFGRILEIQSRDACGPTGPGAGCPSNDPDLCGDDFKLCGRHCICTPDCSHATPENPGDGCDGHCPGVCPTGLVGCCTEDIDCLEGSVCLTDANGARTCRPEDTCANRALTPPLCGAPGAPCGPCPVCTPRCDGLECGPEPNCGTSCGSCGSGEFCDSEGQCASPSVDPTVSVPDDQGGQVDLPDIPPAPASGVGAVAGAFSVSEQGTAQYTLPIDVPPGRLGMTPALNLVYQASRDTGSVGIGWRLEGLPKITRCPKTYALDGYSAAVKNNATDRFCLDGKRLVVVPGASEVPGQYGADGTEYRTLIDSFAKILSHQEDGDGVQLDAGSSTRADRSTRGPDSFEVRTKDGRIMTFGGTLSSLVMNRDGIRQAWLLRRVEDRASNTILYAYNNVAAHLASSMDADGRLPNMLHPSVISYTGHGDVAGHREVRFTFEPRQDPSLRFLQGGVAWALEERLTRVTTYVDKLPVKNYRLVYATSEFSQLDRVFECEGDADVRCKRPTIFSYERSPGFERVPPGPGALNGGQLDVNGDGLPDFLETEVTVEGIDANPELVAAQIAVDVAIGVGTSFLTPAIGMSIAHVWGMVSAPIWGLLGEEPDVDIRNFISINTGARGANFEGGETNGIPCELANAFMDWDRNGWDDVISACEHDADFRVSVGRSLGNGLFSPDPTVLTTTRSVFRPAGRGGQRLFLRPPVFYDIDGDSLQDIVLCKDECSMEVRRRASPTDGFSGAIQVEPPSCTFENGFRQGDREPFCNKGVHTVFDIDGDGTPDLLSKKASGGWHVLRFTRSGSQSRAEWQDAEFPNVSLSSLGDGLQIADFNSDGLSDVLRVEPTYFNVAPSAGRTEGKNAKIWLNTGNGRFALRRMSHPIPDDRELIKIAIADYNDDGRPDFIEHWRKKDRTICGSGLNIGRLPNSGLTVLGDVPDPADFRAVFRPACPGDDDEESSIIDLAADFDGDGSTDLHGLNDIFYGRGAHNLLLSRIEDGLGNVTKVFYDKPVTTDGLPTYDGTCGGPTWPEMCLKRMSGLVAEHVEGARRGTEDFVERRYRYTYSNARMSTTGHGWLGFDRRTIRETTLQTNHGPPNAPTDSELADTTTTVVMEPVARYTLEGVQTGSTAWPYVYPLAGLPKTIVTDRSKQMSPLETAAYRRRARIDNDWEVGVSAAGLSFPRIGFRSSSVWEADVGTAVEVDGQLLTFCSETISTDPYGNVTLHEESCDENDETNTITLFTPDPATWLISNPEFVTVTNHRKPASEQTQTWDYDYFPNGLLFRVIRTPNGLESERQTVRYDRNVFGNIETTTESVTGEPARVTTITYDPSNVFPHLITNPKGQTTEILFDKRWGAPKTIVDPNRIAVRHGYDGLGLLSETRDPEGVTTYTYARRFDEVMTSVGLLMPRTRITVARQGINGTLTGSAIQDLDYRGLPVLTTVDGFGGDDVVSEQAYDFRGRLLAGTTPHTPDSVVIPLTLYSYDGLDRLKRITRPGDGSSAEIQHASIVTLSQARDDWLDGTDCEEEDFSCPVELELSIDEEGKRDLLVKNRHGLVTRNIDGENIDGTPTTMRSSDYQYGAFNRLKKIRHNERTGAATDNPLTVFTHDSYGRLSSHTDPDSGTTSYTYNGFDELKTSFDPKGQLRTFNYDELGRVTSIVDPGDRTTRWIYDQGVNALGRLSESISPATQEAPDGQHLVYTYEPVRSNNRGLLKRLEYIIDSTPYPIDFTYDDLGRTDTIRYPDLGDGPPVVAKYSYDTAGFLNELEEIGSGTPKPVWFLNGAFQGQLTAQEVFGNGLTSNYSYDAHRYFLETIDTFTGLEFIQDLQYTHHRNGQIDQRIRNRTEVRSHAYDALNRLQATIETTTPGAPGFTTMYDYDHLGNMTHRGATTLTYNPNQQRLLTSVGNNAYEYDANGNVSERRGPQIPSGIQNFSYTPFDLPSVIATGLDIGTKTSKFEYSADEERLVRRDTGPSLDRTRHFATNLYQRLVDNIAGSTTEERFRLFAGGREVAQIERRNGVDRTLYFHADNLGTPDITTTSDGEVIRQEYDPFGSEVAGPNTEISRVGFTGHEHDRDLALVDMKGRIYDPLAARFTTPDPIMQAPFWSQGLNRYAYVFNDPVNNTDPSGFEAGFLEYVATGTTCSSCGPEMFGVTLYGSPAAAGGASVASSVAPSAGTTTLSSASPPPSAGGGSAAAAAANLAATAGNIALKAGTESYVGQKPIPGSQSSGAAASQAPSSKPSRASPAAASANKPVKAPVQEGNPDWGRPVPGAADAASPYDAAPVQNNNLNALMDAAPEIGASGPMYDAIGEGMEFATNFGPGGLAKGVVKAGAKALAKSAAKAGARAATARVLQSGGNTISKATAKALGLTREQARNAMHKLKPFVGADPKDVGKIMSNGDYVSKKTGEVLANLFDFVE